MKHRTGLLAVRRHAHRLQLLLGLGLLAVAACSDDTSPAADSAATPDAGAADQWTADLPPVSPDLTAPDLAAPDLAAPDLAAPDLGAPDLGAPDLAAPDLAAPDLAAPDLAAPDLAAPDLLLPDTAPPDNATCAAAQPLFLSGGSVTVSGDTTGAANEYGTSVTCGTGSALAAGQRYYTVQLTAGVDYRILLASMFYTARVLIFQGCGATQIEADCGSGGVSGDISQQTQPKQSGAIRFTPPQSGSWIIAVDGTNPGAPGPFTLTVEDWTTLGHDTCATARPLPPGSGSSVTVTGDTAGALNEFGSGITCGTSLSFPAGQLYYTMPMTAGTTYTVTFTPGVWGSVYVFRGGTCTATAINADCGSGGTVGAVYGSVPPSSPRTVQLTPSTTGDYIIAADSKFATEAGAFTLSVSW